MIINEWDTNRGAKQRCNVSFYLAFSFSRLKRLVRVRRWEGQSVSLSLSLPPPFPSFAFSRHTRAPSLSSSFVNDVTAFFLPRFQRVSTTMHVKSTRASIVTSRVFFSLSFFYNITNAAQRTLQTSCNPLSSPPPFLPRNLISFRSTF